MTLYTAVVSLLQKAFVSQSLVQCYYGRLDSGCIPDIFSRHRYMPCIVVGEYYTRYVVSEK